jgi:hypothetical protein
MSYLSINAVLEERGLDYQTAPEDDLYDALWEAVGRDLPLGRQWIERLAHDVKTTGERIVRCEDPKTPLGQQVIRLLGTDVARLACTKKLGVPFLFNNCCGGASAPTQEQLGEPDIREQIKLQLPKGDGKPAPQHC